MPHDELEDIKLINTKLLREFAEDRNGILDIRAKTKNGEHIDIEIQVIYTQYMACRLKDSHKKILRYLGNPEEFSC